MASCGGRLSADGPVNVRLHWVTEGSNPITVSLEEEGRRHTRGRMLRDHSGSAVSTPRDPEDSQPPPEAEEARRTPEPSEGQALLTPLSQT